VDEISTAPAPDVHAMFPQTQGALISTVICTTARN
jgi:hypothetical protein